MRPDRDALLTAYLDGITELSPAERREIEARLAADPTTRAEADATRALLGQLRDLPPPGDEPVWSALERSIHDAVAAEPTPRRWRWPRVRWLAPGLGLVMAAALALVVGRHVADDEASPRVSARAEAGPGAASPLAAAPSPPVAAVDVVEPSTALWLDGEEVELGPLDGAAALAAVPSVDPLAVANPEATGDDGLLPTSDLGWLEELDAGSMSTLERWLATQPASGRTPQRTPGPKASRKG
jgi:hypothetical protein